jgi:SAM-dependent methyltransferase
MKLHLGCGSIYLMGYINIDSAPDYLAGACDPSLVECNATTFDRYYKQEFGTLPGHVVADVKHDLQKGIPFPDGAADEVVMYQVLEHIPKYEIDRAIDDVYKVLKPGGLFFVSVPDLKETARLLASAGSDEEEDWSIRLIHGTQRNMWSHHFVGFVPRTLEALLSGHGFVRLERLPSINIYPAIHMKAVKP